MKSYLEVARITFKAQFAYRFDVLLGVLLSFARIFLAFIMWSVIFKGKNEIAGFTFNMMITYYIASSFFKKLDNSDGIVWQLSGEIRDGQFTKYMVKPIKPILYFAASCYSKTAFIFTLNLLVTFVWAAIFHKNFIEPKSLTLVLYALAINLLGLNFLILLSYFTGILSFKFMDVGAFNMIKNNLIEFLTGTLIPLVLIPYWLQNIMQAFPFYYIFYLPSMLLMGKGRSEIPAAFAVLAVWNVILLIVNLLTYELLKKSYEGVGI